MKELFEYSGLTTKIRAMQRNSLKQADYDALMNMKSIDEIARFLKEHPAFEEILKEIDLNNVHREELELLLPRKVLIQYEVLEKFAQMQNKNVISNFVPQNGMKYDYVKAWNAIQNMTESKQKQMLLKIVGSEIDIINILNIYRMKKYYGIPVEKIYTELLSPRYKLTKPQIISMVESKNSDELLSLVQKTIYSSIFKSQDSGVTSYENNFIKFMLKIHLIAFQKMQYSFVALKYFVFTSRLEVRNIISIIEGVRYNLTPEAIKQYLIFN